MPDREKIVHQLEQTASFLQRFGFGGFENIQDAIAMLKEQEIVRCKDCKHRGKAEKCVLAAISAEKDYPVFMLDNRGEWCCADGERKEE